LNIFTGPLSIAVPGEVYGYFEAKKKYGNKNITMLSLMQPTIDMCRKGIEVSWSAADSLEDSEDLILKDPGMRYTIILILGE
jgi:gamma-glutamyltranspeptidase/glutathione hydrolase/leukotriene-C4 hydrolase